MLKVVGVALAGSIALGAATSASAGSKLPKVGDPAPDFWVTTFDGKELSLKSLKGQVVVVNFWATWCGPCRQELPLIDAYYKIVKKYGLAVVGVTTEDDVPMNALRPLAKVVSFPMARRFRGGGYKAPEAFPTNIVIDRKGVVRYAEQGAFTLDGLNEVLIPLLKEPVPEQAVAGPASDAAAAKDGTQAVQHPAGESAKILK